LLDLLLFTAARQRKLSNQEVARLLKETPLTKAQLLLAAEPAQIPKDLRHLHRRTAVKHLGIFAITAVPRLGRDRDLIALQCLNDNLRVLT